MKDMSKTGMAKWVWIIFSVTLIAFATILILRNIFPLRPLNSLQIKGIPYQMTACAIFYCGAIAMILLRNKRTFIVAGIGTLALGIGDLINEICGLLVIANFNSIPGLVVTGMIALIPFADLFLIAFSIRYMQGHKRNAIRMSVCMVISLVVWILVTIYSLIISGGKWDNILYVIVTVMPYILLFTIYIIVLLSPGIREDLTEWRVYEISEDMYKTMIIDPKSTIYRGDLIALDAMLRTPERWEESDTVPGARECHVLFGKDMNLRRMTFRRMPGSEKIRVSVIGEGEKAYIQGARFGFNGMLPIDGDLETCKSVRLFGEKGFFIDISIRDDTPVPHKTYLIDRVIDKMKIHKRFARKKKD